MNYEQDYALVLQHRKSNLHKFYQENFYLNEVMWVTDLPGGEVGDGVDDFVVARWVVADGVVAISESVIAKDKTPD